LKRSPRSARLATKYELHPLLITKWKAAFLKKAPDVFADGGDKKDKEKDKLIEELYKQVGRSKIEVDWLKKSWPYF
jgi:transposase